MPVFQSELYNLNPNSVSAMKRVLTSGQTAENSVVSHCCERHVSTCILLFKHLGFESFLI
jgi:hypothetical protein